MQDWYSWRQWHPHAHLRLDSRQVAGGDVFVALATGPEQRARFVADALARGAGAIIHDREQPLVLPSAIPVFGVPRLRDALGALADAWYERPSARLSVWGVTGTNGKTTVSQWLAQTSERLGQACGVVGTLGAGRLGALRRTGFTTPPVTELNAHLAEFVAHGCVRASLEVSSIGIAEGRIDAVRFRGAIMTNLTRDHLDYHGTFEAYAAAKRRFLSWPGLQERIYWLGDATARQWAWEDARAGVTRLWAVADVPAAAWWQEQKETVATELIALTSPARWLRDHWQASVAWYRARQLLACGTLRVPAAGAFQVANALVVLAALLAEGVAWDKALAALAQVQPPPGRMVRVGEAPAVYVDYAHTPDALAQVLAALRPEAEARGGRLWVVFGAGGNRDPGKRPLMGEAAGKAADVVVVTSDNPRWEDPATIAAAVVAGVPRGVTLHVELDRAAAIDWTIRQAAAEDVVLLAGKGHETAQEIAGRHHPFDDAAVAQAALARRALPTVPALVKGAKQKESAVAAKE